MLPNLALIEVMLVDIVNLTMQCQFHCRQCYVLSRANDSNMCDKAPWPYSLLEIDHDLQSQKSFGYFPTFV